MSTANVDKRTDTDADANAQADTDTQTNKLKICCACPHTRKPRDECVVTNGEDKCAQLIEDHKTCLRTHGFDV